MKLYLNKFLSFGILGAMLGFAYYYFIGCTAGGGCPISSNPYISTGYGAFLGLILGVQRQPEQQQD